MVTIPVVQVIHIRNNPNNLGRIGSKEKKQKRRRKKEDIEYTGEAKWSSKTDGTTMKKSYQTTTTKLEEPAGQKLP